MTRKRRRRWNILALVSILMAVMLSIIALSNLNVEAVKGRDSLRLSSGSRALTTDPRRLPPDGWSSLRGTRLVGPELEADIKSLNESQYRVRVGIYANSTYDLDLSVPSFSSNGYIWPNVSIRRKTRYA